MNTVNLSLIVYDIPQKNDLVVLYNLNNFDKQYSTEKFI